ncbi:beta-1,3-galactosyltransferase 2 [Pelobates cultripes]|uniref:Hexosyltransferase n=1 Tax=Pelobates cultripes TaxID=61616 RepID=A0AAD1WHX9_PELCU|nr:beta-1,3-galactosyltransferase 2 [Pelobates cultripes]
MMPSSKQPSLCSSRTFIVLVSVLVSLICLSVYIYCITVAKHYPFNQMQIDSSMEIIDTKTMLNISLYQYIINEPDKCKDQVPFFIFLITTVAKQVEQRQVIRNTWANKANGNSTGVTIMHLFMLGFDKDTDSKFILNESQTYHDIIQKDFQESYNNLTIKTVMGMEWISNYCPQSKYVMKTDSDMFVNTEYLLEMLQQNLPPKTNFFTGAVLRGSVPRRAKESKWYVPFSIYTENYYPNYCSGTGYVFSGDLAPKILRSSYKIKYLHLEDVFIGLCLRKESIDITYPPTSGLFNIYRVTFSPCSYYKLVTSHSMPSSEILKNWQDMQEHKGQCSRYAYKF